MRAGAAADDVRRPRRGGKILGRLGLNSFLHQHGRNADCTLFTSVPNDNASQRRSDRTMRAHEPARHLARSEQSRQQFANR